MKWSFFLALATLLPAQQPCDQLSQLKLTQVTITAAQVIPAGKIPAHCAVKLTARPTSDSEIRIEVWMPVDGWNGKFQQVGNGGWAGSIPAGSISAAVARGYAAAGTDDGHSSQTHDQQQSTRRSPMDLELTLSRRRGQVRMDALSALWFTSVVGAAYTYTDCDTNTFPKSDSVTCNCRRKGNYL